MRRLLLAVALSCPLAAPAQTLPQPVTPNNTVVCLSVNSTLSVGGTSLGLAYNCVGLVDADAGAFVALLISQCPPVSITPTTPGPTTRPCTPTEALAYRAQQMVKGVADEVTAYEKQQAAAAASATVNPVTPNPVQ